MRYDVIIKTLYNTGHNISADEAMVKFKGRPSIKQYQHLKPIKYGFKVRRTEAIVLFPCKKQVMAQQLT